MPPKADDMHTRPKNLYIIVFTLISIFYAQPSYSAFPGCTHSVLPIPISNIAKEKSKKTVPTKNDAALGIASISCGVLAFLPVVTGLWTYIFATGMAALVVGSLLALLAMILGIAGFRRKLKELAITGFFLGLATAILFILAIVGINLT